jgi:hypothetical protein
MSCRHDFIAIAMIGIAALCAERAAGAGNPVSIWNATAVQATLTAGQNGITQSRTLAIVHVAVHDALNSIEPRYQRYAFTGGIVPAASAEAAVAAAARDALIGAVGVGGVPFPGFGNPATQAAALAQVEAAYQGMLALIPDSASKQSGISVGQQSAQSIVQRRSADNATTPVAYTPGTGPGQWQPTPNPVPADPPAAADRLPALLPGWGNVTPFVLRRSTQFDPGGPPPLEGPRYAREYDEVKSVGARNSATRTAEQSSTARFWYEASPAGWSRIASTVAESRGLDLWDTARLLALLNMAMADGFIAGFQTKYTESFWRPVTAIRAGETDGNSRTQADPSWSSFLNTPPVPDYTSTHSVLGAAAAEVLRRFFRRDDIAFTSTSGVPFAGLTRSFSSFSQAAEENGLSRIYAGIHFRSAVFDGISQGRHIGAWIFIKSLRPVHDSEDTGEY